VIDGQVPKGYWLVPAKWYELGQRSQRAYVLQKDKIQLNVNTMLRLPDPIQFEPVKARKKQQEQPTRSSDQLSGHQQAKAPAPAPLPPEREKLNFLSEPKHNEICASLAEVRL